jgi:predicted GNAT superfamily acetyltransferase
VLIRDIAPADHQACIAINNATVPAMNSQDSASFAELVRASAYARVAVDADGVTGFLLALGPGAQYGSPNYRWFSERYEAFLYVDRIAIHERARRRRIGSALYDDLAIFARGRAPCILAEINREPPNPESAVFHERHGFQQVGELRHTYAGAHAEMVVMLRRPVP